MEFNYDFYKKSAEYIKERTDFLPDIGLVLGSGLGHFIDEIEERTEINYSEIPNFLVSTAVGHAGKLVFGNVAGKRVVCMAGRFHYYEGYSFEQLALPMRIFKLLGVKTVILTNAAGAVNTRYTPGDIMLISDHINLMGMTPMRGANIEEFGPRFFDMSKVYRKELRDIAKECAEKSTLNVHEGVYFVTSGPHYETPAEIRAIRTLGGDAVGMSTVTEALTASHCSLPVLAMSVITNMAAGVLDVPLTSEEVIETANAIEEPFTLFVKDIISKV